MVIYLPSDGFYEVPFNFIITCRVGSRLHFLMAEWQLPASPLPLLLLPTNVNEMLLLGDRRL